jgi:hypothetical protein
MSTWLLDRLEKSSLEDQPNPRFAFQGTVNWVRSLAIILEQEVANESDVEKKYTSVSPRKKPNADADTLTCSQLLMGIHNYISLNENAKNQVNPYIHCRSNIVSWYYGIYFSASAMIAATSASRQETHAKTADKWFEDIVEPGYSCSVFEFSFDNLVKKETDAQIQTLRAGNSCDLNTYPSTEEEALGGVMSYLNGTGDYYRWHKCEALRKNLKVDHFRTGKARKARDNVLQNQKICFLHQAFRFRGKANYRDSIFLSYGSDNSDKVEQFNNDLSYISEKFLLMAMHYCSRRLGPVTWSRFAEDLRVNALAKPLPNFSVIG